MNNVDHGQRAHSDLGASSSKRWFTCPASIPLSVGVERKTSVAAEEGTAAHEVCEMALLDAGDASKFIGENVNGFDVTEEMADAVQIYVDEVTRRAGEFSEVSIEQRFSLDWIDPELFGTNDAAIYDDMGVLTILDYKHGRGIPVEAVGNPQLLYYALGAARGLELSEIRLVIVQPRCDHPDDPIREWIVGPDKLKEFESELKERVALVNDARAIASREILFRDFAEAGDHCTFCPAAGFCTKLKDKSLEIAQLEFAPEIKSHTLPDPKFLTPERISEVLDHAGMVEGWIKAAKEHAHSEAERGVEIEGYKLVKKKSNRKWEDENRVVADFEALLGDDLFTKKIRSPAQIEKIVGKAQVANLTIKPDTGNSLVKITDKRKAIMPRAIEDFKEDFTDI